MNRLQKIRRQMAVILLSTTLGASAPATAADNAPACKAETPVVADSPANREVMAAAFVEQVPSVSVFLEPVLAATLQRVPPYQRQDFQSAAGTFMHYDYVDQIIFQGMSKDFTTEELALLTKLLADPAGRNALRKFDNMRSQNFNALQGEIYRAVQDFQTKAKAHKQKYDDDD